MRRLLSAFASLTLGCTALIVGCATTNDGADAPDQTPPTTHVVYTGPVFVTHDAAKPTAKAVVVDDEGVIVDVTDDFSAYPQSQVKKLDGALAVPGLHDAHAHIEGVGKALEQVDLRGCTSTDDLKQRIVDFLAAHPDVSSVQGRGWDQSLFADKQFPTAAVLDGVTDKPILVRRVDGHAALANRVLLDAMGVTAETTDPDGGRFIRGDDGAPSGVLVDNAMDGAYDNLPKPSHDDHKRWLRLGMERAKSFGLTAVHDMGMSLATYKALLELDAEGDLPVRLFVYLYGPEEGALQAALDAKDGKRVKVMGLKYLMDGAMGSRGAALLAPYDDEPTTAGLLTADKEHLKATLAKLDAAGKQIAVHAIGDAANRHVLDVVEQAKPQSSTVRHRIEHAQLVHADDFKRFAQLKVIASMQPTHATSDMRWVHRRVGEERAKGAYAWRTMLQHNVPLAFGSDAPVESIDVRKGLYAATLRQDAEGQPEGGWMPHQRVTSDEALAAFALGAAFAAHEDDLGAFKPGMRFDATLFAADVRNTPKQWLTVDVSGTLLAK